MFRNPRLSGLCLLLTGGVAFLTLSSNSTGITGQSAAGCSCHGASNSSTLISITGIPTAGWVPGTAYNLTISVGNSGASYTRGGFDLTTNIGSFSAAGTGASLNGTTEVYHNTPKVFSSSAATWSVTWTAPSSGTTALIFDCAGNAVNNNGTTGGDAPNKVTNTYTAASATAPVATTNAATALAINTATLNGMVNANNGSTAVVFEWGTTMALGQTITATPATVTGNTATAVSAVLNGLTPNTTYHYQVKGTNSAGSTAGMHQTFTTAATGTPPSVTVSNAASTFGPTNATLQSVVNANGTATTISFNWGLTPAYGNSATPTPAAATGTANVTSAVTLTGLTAGTKYYYQWTALSGRGTTLRNDSFNTQPLSIGTVALLPAAVFPNPATTKLQIRLNIPPAGARSWAVSLTGTLLALPLTGDASSNLEADISALPAGSYFLLLKSGDKQYYAPFQKR